MTDLLSTVASLFGVCVVYYIITFGVINVMLRLGYDEWSGLTAAVVFWGAVLTLAAFFLFIAR